MRALVAPKLDDAKDLWLVYADALQDAGDPRGELIILNQAVADGASAAAREEHLGRHADALYGSLAPYRARLEIDWKWSVPLTLSVKIVPQDDPALVLEALLASPLGSQMRALRLIAQTPSSSDRIHLGPGLALLREGLSETCIALELIDERAQHAHVLVWEPYSPGENLVDFGSLDAIWKIAHLQKLHLYVADTEQVILGAIEAPELRDFALFGLRCVEPHSGLCWMLEPLAAAAWPKLERLALRLTESLTTAWPTWTEEDGAYLRVARYATDNEHHSDDAYDSWGTHWPTELAGLLTQLAQTPLEHLSLTSFRHGLELLTALGDHGLPPSLVSLDLSQSDLRDDALAWFVAHADLFAQLDRLDLRDTLITDCEPLRALDTTVVHSYGEGSDYEFVQGTE